MPCIVQIIHLAPCKAKEQSDVVDTPAGSTPKWITDALSKLTSRPLGEDVPSTVWDQTPTLEFAHPWYNAITDRQRSILNHVEAYMTTFECCV